jgi:glycolate oxidase FAD binding subunit
VTALAALPATVEEAAEVVREAARAGCVVLPLGAGTKRSWAAEPARADVELATTRMAGIVAYEPGDGTITALAGTRWSELVRAAAEHGLHVAPEVPDADRATLGGVLAAGQGGLDRLRLGPARHHVLGMRVVLGDGSVAKTGGRLVKNVTGYDLHRLHTGAHGTLGLIAEASLRLHPRPEACAVATLAAPSRAAALEAARSALAPPHEPWALRIHDLAPPAGAGRFTLTALLGGRADVVPEHARALAHALPQAELLLADREGAQAARVDALWSSLRELERSRGGWPALRAACLPGDLPRAWSALETACAELRLELRVLVDPGVATLDAWIAPLDEPAVRAISAALRGARAQAHWRGLEPELRARCDVFGPDEPAGLALMRRLQRALDPRGTWARGRIAGGL